MPTVIDSLIVKLGLDPSGMKSGAGKARETMKTISKDAKEVSKDLKDLKRAFAEVAVAIGTMYGLKRFVFDLINADAMVARLADNLGMAAGKLNAWGNAMKTVGGSAEEAQGMITSMSMEIAKFDLTGESGMLPYLRALGINLRDTRNHAIPATEAILQLSDKLHNMSRTQEGRTRAYNLARMMGFSDNQFNLMIQGRRALQGLIVEQEKLNKLTPQQAEAAKRAQEQWAKVSTAYEGAGRVIATALMPYVMKLAEWMQNSAKWVQENKDTTVKAFAVIGSVIGVGLVSALITATTAAVEFAIAMAMNPITWVVAGIVALTTGIYLLIKSWKAWRDGAPNQYWDDFARDLNMIKGAWDTVTTAIENATAALGKWWDKQKRKAAAKWDGAKQAVGSVINAAKQIFIKDASGAIVETRSGGHRNWRNNNPGNIEYGPFAKSHGAIGSDGRFAVFRTINDGFAAADALLKSSAYANRSIAQSVERWAPRNENDTDAYINAYRSAGFDVNKRYSDLSLSEQRRFLQTKMRIEGGAQGKVTRPSAAQAARNLQASHLQQVQNNNQRIARVENHVNIGTITTQAKDAAGIGREIRRGALNSGLVNQADYGLS